MKCEMPTTRTNTIFQLLGYEQELRLTALPTFEDVVKSCLRVKHNTTEEHGDHKP